MIKTQSELASVKQFDCQNCGNGLHVHNSRAQYISCQYCGSVLDAASETHQILQKLDKPTKHKPMSFIELGQIANFYGRNYQVIARSRWRSKYNEYWSEEGESGYSREVWIYDEWLLIDERKTYFYLIEDKEGYYISEEIIPQHPTLLPNNLRMKFFDDQPNSIVREYGDSELIYFEGESNYRIAKNEQKRFAMFKHRGINFESEWRMHPEHKEQIKEIEFFKETPISRRKLLESFQQNQAIEDLYKREGQWRFVAIMGSIVSFLALFFMFVSIGEDGDQIFYQSLDTQQLAEDTGFESQPIEISEAGIFKLELNASQITPQSEFFIFAYILDKDRQAINQIQETFYYYSGTDSDGSWTESRTNTDKIFKLKEPGTYYLQLYKNRESVFSNTLEVKMNKGIILTRYFVLLFIAFLIFTIYAFGKSRGGF
ncbi:MAG: hypothetical protein R8P61_26505 [Bacteroidia bacterium]|nr:hypothetical protein [Bacteroidia bacterium]